MSDCPCQAPTYSAWDLASGNLIDGFKSRRELVAWLRSLDQVDGICILEAVGERRVRWLEPRDILALSYTDPGGVARSLTAPRMSPRSAGRRD